MRLGFTEHMTWAVTAARQLMEEADAADPQEGRRANPPLVPESEISVSGDDRELLGEATGYLFLRSSARR